MTRIPLSAGTEPRRTHRLLVLGLMAVIAAITATLAHQLLKPSATSSASSTPSARPTQTSSPSSAPSALMPLPRERGGALGEADGAVPDGVTVFDGEVPAVAKLDPELLKALRQAATDAADDDVEFAVNSGWRSSAYQDQLLREAVAEYGSEEEAARWVATPATSPHVSGDAVDVGPSDAAAWLSGHGAGYGLCQIYRNEAWHYELRPEAIDDGCPRMYADPTQDPRMQK
ncbi:M15 family metallopeptidase [Streptomyces sp. NPDC050658]|uniref:M15 family metallopeptidase n=1 Tax=unclassified Streptomyces TaxID=2593676 RepID=UPI00342E9F92